MAFKRDFWSRCLHCLEDGTGELRSFPSFDARKRWWRSHRASTGHQWAWRPTPEDQVRGTTLTAEEADVAAAKSLADDARLAPPRLVKRKYGGYV